MDRENYENLESDQEITSEVSVNNSTKGSFLAGMLVGLLIALLAALILFFGFSLKKAKSIVVDDSTHLEFLTGAAVDEKMVTKLQILEKVIDQYFYLREVTNEELQDGVYRGIMSALDDPYSEYYTAEELQELLDDSEGIYYGIGAYVSLDSETSLPKISGIIDNSPAQDANLRPNDLIYEVNGVSMFGATLREAVSQIKGPEGTEVILKLIREGENDYLTIPLIRRKVEAPTVEFSLLEDEIAYIQIIEFDDVTVEQFKVALSKAKETDAKGIILDLRGNPGGNLTAVVDMCRMILPEGLIVYTQDKNGKRSEYACDGKSQLEIPLVVLVDMNSASASEIMAGAIKDYGIGTLVGTTTFGKGIVQQIIPFSDGTAVKVTVSAYYTPNGNNIHGIGIEPDVVCEFDGDAYYGSEEHPDNQLEKAKEVLRQMY